MDLFASQYSPPSRPHTIAIQISIDKMSRQIRALSIKIYVHEESLRMLELVGID